MSDPFKYITRPTSNGNATTTQPVYRGTKTQADVIAEITTRHGATPITIDSVLCAFSEIVIDWTTQGWKVAPCHDLIGFRLTTGGSAPIGGAEDWDFDGMNINLTCQWGETGEAHCRTPDPQVRQQEPASAAPRASRSRPWHCKAATCPLLPTAHSSPTPAPHPAPSREWAEPTAHNGWYLSQRHLFHAFGRAA